MKQGTNLSKKQIEEIFERKAQGESAQSIASSLGVHVSTVYWNLNNKNKPVKKSKPGRPKGSLKKVHTLETLPQAKPTPMFALVGSSQEITSAIRELFS
jgi:DNA invertase Pin-like site-specific DNA recombinase